MTSVRCYINLLASERQYMSAAFFATCVQLRRNLQVRLATKRKTLLKVYLRLLTYDYLQEGGVGGPMEDGRGHSLPKSFLVQPFV